MGPTGISQIPRWKSPHQSDPHEAPRFTRTQPLVHEPCDHTTDMTSRSSNVDPPTVSQYRTRPLLNNSGHCLESRTGSRSVVEDTTTSADTATSNSTNVIPSTSFHNRTRPLLANSSHCMENCTNRSTSRSPMQDSSNHIMEETISPSSKVDPSTTSDIRTRPTSNNSGHC